MSREYPCVYYQMDGICRKYSADGIIQYCVQGPCPDETSSNADRIRAMSDEELAETLFNYKECSKNCVMNNGKHCYQICEEESVILKWLQQPYEED